MMKILTQKMLGAQGSTHFVISSEARSLLFAGAGETTGSSSLRSAE
jgi:hypothetical protein